MIVNVNQCDLIKLNFSAKMSSVIMKKNIVSLSFLLSFGIALLSIPTVTLATGNPQQTIIKVTQSDTTLSITASDNQSYTLRPFGEESFSYAVTPSRDNLIVVNHQLVRVFTIQDGPQQLAELAFSNKPVYQADVQVLHSNYFIQDGKADVYRNESGKKIFNDIIVIGGVRPEQSRGFLITAKFDPITNTITVLQRNSVLADDPGAVIDSVSFFRKRQETMGVHVRSHTLVDGVNVNEWLNGKVDINGQLVSLNYSSMSDKERKKYNRQKIKALDKAFRPMVKNFLRRAEKQGFLLRLTHGYRSCEEQNALYEQGRSIPGPIVTNARCGESFHNFGLAVDVFDMRESSYGAVDWDELGIIATHLNIEHGDRGYTDLPHFQYRGKLSLESIQGGERPRTLKKYR